MKIAENVEILELKRDTGTIYPALVWDDREVILIDTGLPAQLDLLRGAVENAGFSLEKVTKVILTHHDMDHIGNAKILHGFGTQIIAHESEAPYVEGGKPSPKLVKMEQRYNELSDGEREFYNRVKAGAPNFYTPISVMLKDGEMLPYCGGIKVIHTPGHTPGHIALLFKQSNILIAGDAANINNGVLTGPNPQHTLDMPLALESFEKVKSTGADITVCYHGGIYYNKNA